MTQRQRILLSAISMGWSSSAIVLATMTEHFGLAVICIVVGCVTAYAVVRAEWTAR